MEIREVIRRPLISEKSMAIQEQNRYAFEVDSHANKFQIRQAVEQVFKVKVLKVRTITVRGKFKRQGRTGGYTKEWKKAFVTLAEGHSITVFEGL